MKILFFTESLGPGGKERRIVELIKGLTVDKTIKIELVLTKTEITYNEIFETNTKIHYIVRKYGKKDPTLFYKFFKIAKKFKPDMIHVWGNFVAIYAIPTKVFLNIPMLNSQITNATGNFKSKILNSKLTFFFSDKILSNSFAGLKAYKAPIQKSLVIYNGFDFKRIENLEDESFVRNKLQITSHFIVGMVASFTEKKDYTTYISAANLVLEKEKYITFLCIGSGDSSEYEKIVPEKNKNKILFLGRRDHVESIMQICDLGILTTNHEQHGEGISNAILEFSALGKPVIATSGGGTAEIIEDKISGVLINPKSPEVLAEKILNLIENEDLRIRMGEKAREVVVIKFSISKMIDDFKTQYYEVLKN